MKLRSMITAAAVAMMAAAAAHAVQAASSSQTATPKFLAPGLILPAMNPERGKMLFASKGCVVCHSVNGVGGTDAPKLDASIMPPAMNPFEFFAKMWRGAMPMIMMQQNEIGHQIEFTGQDLADIVAFVHNAEVQKTFSKDDIPPEIAKHMDEEESDRHEDRGMMGRPGMMHGQGMGQGMMGTPSK
jgi:cytochrome c